MECFLALKTEECNIKIESVCLHLVNMAVLQTATFVLLFNLSLAQVPSQLHQESAHPVLPEGGFGRCAEKLSFRLKI